MTRGRIAATIAVVAVFAAVLWFFREAPGPSPAPAEPAEKAEVRPGVPPAATEPPHLSPKPAPARPAAADPRLAALMVSPKDALIEFLPDREGRVIKEIDNDPNSAGYRKPLREYTYLGDKVIRLVAYHYLGSQVQVITADVRYKPDGSIDQYRESTDYRQNR